MEFLSELGHKLGMGKQERRIILPSDDKPMDLGNARLAISTNLGTDFTEVLEMQEAMHFCLSKEHEDILSSLPLEALDSYNFKRRIVVNVGRTSQGIRAAAYLLRVARPPVIIGTQITTEDDGQSILRKLGFQMGMPPGMCTSQDIHDRLIGRKSAVVLLGINKMFRDRARRLEREFFAKIPPTGLLIISS